ncbi:MAG TPA: hypothetical protein VKX17_11835 [Planctomycetota bacterium]|nr:hypothetical protein [Planctomycetota bacterium]
MTTQSTANLGTAERAPACSQGAQKVLPHLTQIVRHALMAAEAQFSICYLKLVLCALAFLVLVPATLLVAAFGIYGLVLLDRAADIALSSAANPLWLSPLVRGSVYVLLMSALFVPVLWMTFARRQHTAEKSIPCSI